MTVTRLSAGKFAAGAPFVAESQEISIAQVRNVQWQEREYFTVNSNKTFTFHGLNRQKLKKIHLTLSQRLLASFGTIQQQLQHTKTFNSFQTTANPAQFVFIWFCKI